MELLIFKRIGGLAFQKVVGEHSLNKHPATPIPQCFLSIYIPKEYVFDTYIHHLQTRSVKKLLVKEEDTHCKLILEKDVKCSFNYILLLIEQEKDEWFRIEQQKNPTDHNRKWIDMEKANKIRIRDDLKK